MRRGIAAWWREAVASASHELYREFRRQAGDERVPPEVRQGLRELANRAHIRSVNVKGRVLRLPRRVLREPAAVAAPAHSLGEETGGKPLVIVEARMRPDIAASVVTFLTTCGYHVLDFASKRGSQPADTCPLSAAAFVVCGSVEMQQQAYRTNTPSLTINATDPFSAYPIRANGLFLLKTAIDLDTGRVLHVDDLLTDWYFRNLRNCGYRENTAQEVIGGIEELRAGITSGWTETAGQARFRSRVVEAGVALADSFPFVAEWGPDAGFIGDGRLVRIQADTTS